MKVKISKKWLVKRAALERGCCIEAGAISRKKTTISITRYNRLKRASLELARTLDHYLNTGNESRDSLRAAIVNFEEATGLKVD